MHILKEIYPLFVRRCRVPSPGIMKYFSGNSGRKWRFRLTVILIMQHATSDCTRGLYIHLKNNNTSSWTSFM